MRVEFKFMDAKLDIVVRNLGFEIEIKYPPKGDTPQSPQIIEDWDEDHPEVPHN